MHASLSSAVRFVGHLVLASLVLCQAAQAAPATEAGIREYFQLTGTEAHLNIATEAIEKGHEEAWRNERDPVQKEGKKMLMDLVKEVASADLTWEKLEPLAIASYQQELSDSDVQDMIVHARSQAGKVTNQKWIPALLEHLPAIQQYIKAAFSELNNKKGPPMPIPAMPPPGPNDALLQTFLRDIPGDREEFEERVTPMVTMAGVLAQGDNTKNRTRRARAVATVKQRLPFDNITALKARMLANVLSADEINLLIEDNRRPQRQAQLRKVRQAEREFQARTPGAM
ncbi:hypothetical protein [Massilia antarctica]|uniref:hypothetical protein n=1 Tax=Massilia antarctica TaxID=2765360 RepID=UPI0006BB651C|nr:hypothetical protein [Massilia sp. H27-R4]MCY0912688.1 hypothetical protein [Massilia sp. H27-R4]CUI03753.1 hypothetical protein BN2497_2283 [Janthinobacterium sp. CG23_2]CUU27539.1 hypothetical protein BN3177_2283 [Janthinobacterium sp. CG23_2]